MKSGMFLRKEDGVLIQFGGDRGGYEVIYNLYTQVYWNTDQLLFWFGDKKQLSKKEKRLFMLDNGFVEVENPFFFLPKPNPEEVKEKEIASPGFYLIDQYYYSKRTSYQFVTVFRVGKDLGGWYVTSKRDYPSDPWLLGGIKNGQKLFPTFEGML